MDQQTDKINNFNEYSFRWGKQLGFLTLKTLNTKLTINRNQITLNMDRYYLGLFKGRSILRFIPLTSISNIEIKSLLSFSDLSIAGIYLLGAIFLNPLFYFIVPLCIWASINTNIIIATKSDEIIKIPCFSKRDAKEFTSYIHDIHLS